MIHVVIPAAGAGSRFIAAGYGPKIWADVNGVPMLRAVVDNLRPAAEHRITVVVTRDPPDLGEGVEVVHLKKVTRGAVETALMAGIGVGPLLLANCDQLLSKPMANAMVTGWSVDGVLATFPSASPAHSYVKLDAHGYVTDIAEKQVISDRAVGGVYYFTDGLRFAEAAATVLDEDRRVLNELYVSTVLAEMMSQGASLRTLHGSVTTLGTPEELDTHLGRVPA